MLRRKCATDKIFQVLEADSADWEIVSHHAPGVASPEKTTVLPLEVHISLGQLSIPSATCQRSYTCGVFRDQINEKYCWIATLVGVSCMSGYQGGLVAYYIVLQPQFI